MNKTTFPLAALVISALLLAILFRFGTEGGESRIPLLTMLLMSEFSFLITTAGTYISGKTLLESGLEIKQALIATGCFSLAIISAFKGYSLWVLVNPG